MNWDRAVRSKTW